MESFDQKIRKISFQYGIILGVVVLVLSIFTFYYITQMSTSFLGFILAPVIFSILIPIALVVVFCFDIRKRIGGYWNFRQATTGIFIMFLLAYVIQAVGRDLVFVKLVEPNMVEKTQQAAMNATVSMMEKSGTDQAQIDEKKATLQKQFDDQKNVTTGKFIQGICISIILIFVCALIFGALFKKDKPLYDVPVDEELSTT
ncbi:MAG: hypothetical protein NVSMB24_03360 [Mucilaginibacter sp.]